MVINKKVKNITCIIVAAALLITGFFLYSTSKNNTNSVETGSSEQNEREVDYAPPTAEDIKEVDANKSRIGENTTQTQPTESNKATVTPEITIAEISNESVEVASYVPTIFENNGNCVIRFTKASQTITRKVLSVAEGRATYCPSVRIPLGEFPEKGTWRLVVTYDSNVYTGTSSVKDIEIK